MVSVAEETVPWETVAAIAVPLLICFICSFFLNAEDRQDDRDLRSVRGTMSERRRANNANRPAPSATPATETGETANTEALERREIQILSLFHFQTVLPDKTNTTAASLRQHEILVGNDEEEDDGKIDKKSVKEKSSIGRLSIRNMLSSWRKPSISDECCICLEGYKPGEVICAAKTDACDHVFHEDCVREWLKNHDRCPLCRVNLMNVEDGDS